MEIKELQKQASEIFINNSKRDGIKVDTDYLILKLTEELGEFVQSYIVHERRCRPAKYLSAEEAKRELSKELADVLGLVFSIADKLDVDIEEALVKKWITKEWLKK